MHNSPNFLHYLRLILLNNSALRIDIKLIKTTNCNESCQSTLLKSFVISPFIPKSLHFCILLCCCVLLQNVATQYNSTLFAICFFNHLFPIIQNLTFPRGLFVCWFNVSVYEELTSGGSEKCTID